MTKAIAYYNGKKYNMNEKVIHWKCEKGILHRENGPAIIWESGGKRWFLKGIEYTEQNFNKMMRNDKIEEILK